MAVRQPIEGSSTPAQRRAIVLAGRRVGLDVDDLRAMAAGGSLRALSFEAASAMLDSLNRDFERPTDGATGGDRRAAKGARRTSGRRARPGIFKMITPRQREAIESYRVRLGWGEAHLDDFLKKTFDFTRATLASRRDASRVLTVLGRLVDHAVTKCSEWEKDETSHAAGDGEKLAAMATNDPPRSAADGRGDRLPTVGDVADRAVAEW